MRLNARDGHSSRAYLASEHPTFIKLFTFLFTSCPTAELSGKYQRQLVIMSQEFTYADVAVHSTKKDLYVVIHDKVYNSSSFVDEHP